MIGIVVAGGGNGGVEGVVGMSVGVGVGVVAVVAGVGVVVGICCSMMCSIGCGGSIVPSSSFWIVSLAVSVPLQKKGGLSHHPICGLFGTTICKSSRLVDVFEGKT